MSHAPYIREVPEAKAAVLCIHGIFGTPRHFDRILSAVPDNWSVYNILLDGHGLDVKAFTHSSMSRWQWQVGEVVDQLAQRYDHVLILAHSMGALLAVEAALRHPEVVRQLVLLAVPLSIWVRFSAVVNSCRVIFGCVSSHNAVAVATKESCSVAPDRRFWRYIGCLPRYVELFREAYATRKRMRQLCTPCRVFQSQKDELVSRRSQKLFVGLPTVMLSTLPESRHYFYSAADEEKVRRELASLCARVEVEHGLSAKK